MLLEGREHLARRRLMLPPFHGQRMRAYESIVRDVVANEVERWPEDEPFALHPRMQRVTLEVILRAVFGVTDPARGERLAEHLGRLLTDSASAGLQFGVLLSRRLGAPDPLERLERQRRAIDAMLDVEISERRSDPRDDILSMLLAARFEDGVPMADAEIRGQLITLLLAGHETTATGLAWTFDLLLRHPQALARLLAELDAGSDDAYVRAVVAESLRLRPVVPLAGRRLASGLRIGPHVLPPGTDVTPAIWLTHTRAETYPEPLAFRPERFLEGAPSTYAWIPFGGGVGRCLGAAFAEMEMRVALAEILRRRILSPAPRAGAERVARRNVTFSPAGGTRVVARTRMPQRAPAAEGVGRRHVGAQGGAVSDRRPEPPALNPLTLACGAMSPDFEAAAAAYDRHVGRYGSQLAEGLIAAAGVRAGQHVLDVGCGPGPLTTALAGLVGPSRVAAVDPSEEFVAACRARVPGADVRVAAAEQLPFEDARFGAVLAQLVVPLMEDREAGVREMVRVAGPGGVVAACVWDSTTMPMLRAYWDAALAVAPERAGAFDEGRRVGYPSAEQLGRLWAAGGLTDVGTGETLVHASYQDFDDLFAPFTAGTGNSGSVYRSLDERGRDRLRADAFRRLGEPSGSFTLTARAWWVRGKA